MRSLKLIKIIALDMDIEKVVPEKSPNDQRHYEALKLSNNLKLLLIQDPENVKSACSVSVGVGSFHDPARSLGLAHFLEHMLFMGSGKFPSHNEYSSFMSENSGFDNAYTSDVETNYYFEIKNSHFGEAVDRLANFFTGALLNKECIQKERQAVHEEYVLWTNDDNCRKWEVLRKLGSPPYSHFTIGNQETLNHEFIREDLVEFYNHYYSANIINAVLCSSIPIEDMKRDLLQHFECIKDKNVQFGKFDLHFTKEQTGKLVLMQSIKDEAVMEFFFVLDYLKDLYKTHVSDYLTHVIGHEGKNSLLSILKLKQFATELSVYTHDLLTQTLLGVEVKLTELGEQQSDEVYNIVMDYLTALRPDKSIFEEIQEQKKISFQFKEKSKISEYVCHLSSKMHHIPLPEILNHSTLFEDYNEDLITKFLSQVNPFNVIIVFSSSAQLEDSITEKYLGAKYKVEKLPVRKNSGIEFSPLIPNPFIPIATDLIPKQADSSIINPLKIRDNVEFLHDDSFRVCKGGIDLKIKTSEDQTFMEFYSKYLELLLKQLTYPAETLNVQVDVDFTDSIILSIFGFNDTVCRLFEQISEQVKKSHLSAQAQTIFRIALEDLIQDYTNFYCQESDDIANTTKSNIMEQGTPSVKESIDILQTYEYEDISQRISKLWENSLFSWVVVGNFSADKISNLTRNFEEQMRGIEPEIKIPPMGCIKVTETVRHGIQLTSQDLSSSCCIINYQLGPYNEKLYYIAQLLENHINEPFFNELRTERQMAYYLGVKVNNTRGVLGLEFILVSSSKDPYDISLEIKKFAENFFGNLDENLKEEKFKKIKESVATKIATPHNNLKAKFDFIVKQINNRTRYFQRKEEQQIWSHLNLITLDDLKNVWSEAKNRTLEILVASKNHEEAYNAHQAQTVEEETLKKSADFWEDFFKQ